MPFGIGGSTQTSTSTTTQNVFEADLFTKLFSGASNVAGTVNTEGLTAAANQLFSSGTGFLQNLQDVSAGTDPSGAFLQDVVSGGSGLVDENIGALSEDLGRLFNEQLLPGVRSDAIAGGQLGGGRQGVAEAGAIDTIAREFRRGALDIRNADIDRRVGAAETLAGRTVSAATAGLQGARQQFDLANAGTLAPFSPFLTLAEILGRPTTLTDSTSTSTGKSLSFSLGG